MSQATRAAKAAEIQSMQSGRGKYVLRNITSSEIILPKPSLDPQPLRSVFPGRTFIGDSYHLNHLGNMVHQVEILEAPITRQEIEASSTAAAVEPEPQPVSSSKGVKKIIHDVVE